MHVSSAAINQIFCTRIKYNMMESTENKKE